MTTDDARAAESQARCVVSGHESVAEGSDRASGRGRVASYFSAVRHTSWRSVDLLCCTRKSVLTSDLLLQNPVSASMDANWELSRLGLFDERSEMTLTSCAHRQPGGTFWQREDS